ncbi:hypothetical protein GCM10007231_05540 [Nocardioides daphniae]|uniref:Uncharacterized protein n=1 Tax=Nocardioides daphniae TaxID=402297 RepID=A0ABQ1Q1U9_9ACTN|nr:hypothetical protein GCM10007231_05540 [Nocardioides daphniae]
MSRAETVRDNRARTVTIHAQGRQPIRHELPQVVPTLRGDPSGRMSAPTRTRTPPGMTRTPGPSTAAVTPSRPVVHEMGACTHIDGMHRHTRTSLPDQLPPSTRTREVPGA